MARKIVRRSDCPISFSLDIFGDKWSLLILRDMMFKGKHTYGEFASSDEKIATNILADRLALLEMAGLLTSSQDKKRKTRILYSLTQKALALLPVLIEIIQWAAKYDKHTRAPAEFVRQIKKDKKKLILELTRGLKAEYSIHSNSNQ